MQRQKMWHTYSPNTRRLWPITRPCCVEWVSYLIKWLWTHCYFAMLPYIRNKWVFYNVTFLFILSKGVGEDHKGQDLESGIWSLKRDPSGHIREKKACHAEGPAQRKHEFGVTGQSGCLGADGWGDVGGTSQVWAALPGELAFITGQVQRHRRVTCTWEGNGTQLPKHKLQMAVVVRVHFQGDGVSQR